MVRASSFMLLMFVLAGCTKQAATVFPGYMEAEYTRVAAPIAGRLTRLAVSKGQEVNAGESLFVLEADSEQAGVAEAQSRLARNEAQLADLAKGKRQEELDVLKAQQLAVQASLALAQSDLKRQSALARSGFVSTASLESLQARVRAETARLEEVEAQLRVAQLAARRDAQAAARADVATAQAQLLQSQWRLDQKTVTAPVAAWVDDTLYRVGEWVPAGSPVVSLREASALKVRFFVPQAQLPQFAIGTAVTVRCDGCQPFTARVQYVAPNAEFTPPVIYSRESRAKLVFLVEAQPDKPASLTPGLPVDVLPGAQP